MITRKLVQDPPVNFGGGVKLLPNLLVTSLLTFLSFETGIPQPSAPGRMSGPCASTLLVKSFAAMSGTQTVNDVTLKGTARRIVGSDYESGVAVFKALPSGAGRKQGSRVRAFHGHHVNVFCVKSESQRLRR